METAITVQDYLESGTVFDIQDAIIEHAVEITKHNVFNAVAVIFDDGSWHVFNGVEADIVLDTCKHENIEFYIG